MNHLKNILTPKEGVSGKQNVINRIFKHLGELKVKHYEHGFKRGVFFRSLYENGLEYLRNEIKDKDLVMKQKYVWIMIELILGGNRN